MAVSRYRFLKDAWELAWPYWRSDERWSAAGLLGAIVALNLFSVWLNVRFTVWYKEAYDALQRYNWGEFWWQAGIFSMLAAALVSVSVYQLYLTQILEIRWRTWLTGRFLHSWLDDRAYYHMQLDQSATDNPDQRIAVDLQQFTTYSLDLSIGLLNSVVTLFSFLFLLWTLSGIIHIPLGGGRSLAVSGYLVYAAVFYAVVGTLLTRWIGRPLAQLLFDQQRYEADFRFSLIRLRENAESVAFYGGEPRELNTFQSRFARIITNWWGIILRRKKLMWLTQSYSQIAVIFPFFVAAPAYFAKQIQLGGLIQISSAFGQVQSSLSFIVTSYTDIAQYRAIVERLDGFRRRVATIAEHRRQPQPIVLDRGGEGIELSGLRLDLPDGKVLRQNVTLAARPDRPALITGPSGAGKSTLLRAIAGLWPFGRGEVRIGQGRMLFLPQRPYLPLGTLADALAYPGEVDPVRHGECEAALRAVGLGYLTDQLDRTDNWAQRLSIGEQQRIGFARVLLARPEIVFLDEATSALDEAGEAALYRLLREAEWRPTIVSVGHHNTLRRFHDQIVDLGQRTVSEAAEG